MIARQIFTRLFLLAALAAPIASAFAGPPPAVGSLPDSERRTSYSITANTCICAVNLQLFASGSDVDSWIQVWVNGARVLSTDPTYGWSLSSVTGPLSTIPRPITNAVLTFNSPITGTVQIVGAERPRQLAQFQENTGVPARALNQRMTEITAVERELWDKTNDLSGRGLFFAPGNTTGAMPSPAACAGALLGFDNTGLNPLCLQAVASTVTTPTTTVPGDVVTWGGTTGKSLLDGGKVRLQLQGPQTIYVNGNSTTATCAANSAVTSATCAAGNDSTGNGTVAAPYLTLQKGLTAARTVDEAGFQITVVLAYTTPSSAGALNYGATFALGGAIGAQGTSGNAIFITGDLNSPTSVSITAPNNPGGGALADGVYASDSFIGRLEYLQLDNQGTASDGLRVGQQAIVDLLGVTCGASWTSTTGACIYIEKGGVTNGAGSPMLTLAGCGALFLQMTGGIFNAGGVSNPAVGTTIAIPSAIACSSATAVATGNAELLSFSTGTFTGSGVAGTTGTRAILAGAAYVNYSGGGGINSIFPGNVNATIQDVATTNHAGDTRTVPLPVASGGTGATAAGATAVGNISGATPVASCSGAPSGSFAVTNGIVTHC